MQSVIAAKEVEQGNDLKFVLCREPRYSGIVSNKNVRSFYYVADSGKRIPASQVSLPEIAYENTADPCVPLSIPANKRPDAMGKYSFCQQVTFNAWGHEKTANFCSTEWRVVPASNVLE